MSRVLAATALAAALLTACGDPWRLTLDPDDEYAYGGDLLPGLLRATYPEAEFVELERTWAGEGLDSALASGSVYVAAGAGLPYSATEAEALARYVRQGGHAFLVGSVVADRVFERLSEDSCTLTVSLYEDEAIGPGDLLKFANGETVSPPTLTRFAEDSVLYTSVVDPRVGCQAGARPQLGLVRRRINDDFTAYDTEYWPVLVQYPRDAGTLTVLSAAELLSNVYLADSLGRELAEDVLSALPPEATRVYFDRDRRATEWQVYSDNNPAPPVAGGARANSSILSEVLARPALATAWYLLLLGALTFVVFTAKRRQRVVPVVQPRRNTTHDHLGNVSRLYLDRPDNARMARKQLTLFEAYAQRRFGLAPVTEAADRDRLGRLGGVEVPHVESLARYLRTLDRGQNLSNAGFVQLVTLLQALYTQLGRRYD